VVMVSGLADASPLADNAVDSARQPRGGIIKKLLPYINLRFKQPFACNASNKDVGTCMSSQDCETAGGSPMGDCADGYGACCVITAKCGDSVARNRTILASNSTSGSLNCQYKIKKPLNDSALPLYSRACQVRLDFDKLTLAAPDATTSLCSADSLQVSGSPANFGKICGENAGQHIYLPIGASDDVATITINGGSATTTSRDWKIRTTYIPCDSDMLAPAGCLQYYTGDTGVIKSFNNVAATATQLSQVGGLRYAACVSSPASSCGLTLEADAGAFSLSGDAAAATKEATKGATCVDSVGLMVRDKAGTPSFDTYFCGTQFDAVTTYAAPFSVQVATDETEPDTDKENAGFALKFSRVAC